MSASRDCIFCRIVQGEVPAHKVYEDDACLAFLDIAPLAEGHVLVIPKPHAETLDTVPPETAAHLGRVLPKLGAALRSVTGAAGFNVLQNNGTIAGQEVPHVHFHMIPRHDDDGLGYRWRPQQYAEGRAESIAQQLSHTIDDRGQ